MPDEEATWSYRDAESGAVKGPFTLGELSTLLASGEISAQTQTRSGDYALWRPFQEQPEFERARLGGNPRRASGPSVEETSRQNPIVFAMNWLYGLGGVAIGTFFYCAHLWSRNGGDGVPLNWLVDLFKELVGYGK